MKGSKTYHAALNAVGPDRDKKFAFKVTYQVWKLGAQCWRHCEFYIAAFDKIEAKRLAVLYCRDNNGQPIDYHNMEVEQVAK